MKRFSTSLIIREKQIKSTMSLHRSEWPSSKSLQTINAGEGVEKKGHTWLVGGACTFVSYRALHRLCSGYVSEPNWLFSNLLLIEQMFNVVLLLLSRFSRVRLCATPETAAHQAPPSLGFSRQEHWSGLPFPSPMHESKKWKWSRSVMSDS